MEIIKENLGKVKHVSLDDPLPIQYVEEIINDSVLTGRVMGFMAEISKRTDKPITFDEWCEGLSGIDALLRVIHVITDEEQRVLFALVDEMKWVKENDKSDSPPDIIRSMQVFDGWKMQVEQIFAEGGNMYDLLVFTDRKLFK